MKSSQNHFQASVKTVASPLKSRSQGLRGQESSIYQKFDGRYPLEDVQGRSDRSTQLPTGSVGATAHDNLKGNTLVVVSTASL